jgi:hypothetical protein
VTDLYFAGQLVVVGLQRSPCTGVASGPRNMKPMVLCLRVASTEVGSRLVRLSP